jgi:hypothetical protein
MRPFNGEHMKTILTLIVAVLSPIAAQADALDTILNSEKDLNIRPSELADALTARVRGDFDLTEYQVRSFRDNPSTDAMGTADVRCAVNQFLELKKVNWKRYGGRNIVTVRLTTRYSPFAGEITPRLEDTAESTNDPKDIVVNQINIVHRSAAGCTVHTAAEIENAMATKIEAERVKIAENKRRQDALDAVDNGGPTDKDKLLEILSGGSAPAVGPRAMAPRNGECDNPQVVCPYLTRNEQKRAPAYIQNADASAALGNADRAL